MFGDGDRICFPVTHQRVSLSPYLPHLYVSSTLYFHVFHLKSCILRLIHRDFSYPLFSCPTQTRTGKHRQSSAGHPCPPSIGNPSSTRLRAFNQSIDRGRLSPMNSCPPTIHAQVQILFIEIHIVMSSRHHISPPKPVWSHTIPKSEGGGLLTIVPVAFEGGHYVLEKDGLPMESMDSLQALIAHAEREWGALISVGSRHR